MADRAATAPEFVCRAEAARLLGISVDTWDIWVQDGFAPPPAIVRGQIKRWHWPTVAARFTSDHATDTSDPFIQGVANANQKARGRVAS